MANMLFTNNAATTLASSISSTATSLTVASGTGSLFPNPTGTQYFYCTLQATTGSTIEIIKVTARSSDTFTIIRGQDGTGGSSFTAGDKVELRIVAATMNDLPKLDEVNQFTATNNYFGGSSTTTSMGVGYGSLNFYSSTVGSNVNTSMFFSATGTSLGAQQFSLSYNNSGTPSSSYQFYGDGTAYKTGSSTAWTNTSDVRLKTNIANYTPGLTQLLQIQPRTWQWNGLAKTTEGADGFGLVADEIQQIVPSMVKTTPMLLNPTDTQTTDIKQVDVTELTWILINSVKELNATVTAQAVEIEALKTKTGI